MKLDLKRSEIALKRMKYIVDKLLKFSTKNRFYKKVLIEATLLAIQTEDKIRFLKTELFREAHSETEGGE